MQLYKKNGQARPAMRIVENLLKAAEGSGVAARNHRIEYGRIKLLGSDKTHR